MKTTVLSLACTALAATTFAIDFPDADGSHDPSTAAAWGGTLPGASDSIVITGKTQTVTFANPVDFGQLQNMLTVDKGYTLTFDQTAHMDTLLKFKGYQHQGYAKSKVHAVFKGGTWNFGGNYFCSNNGSVSFGSNRSLTITDGAVMDGITTFALGYTAHTGLSLLMDGGSRVRTTGSFKTANNNQTTDPQNKVVITGGSHLDVGGTFSWDSGADSTSSMLNLPNVTFKDYLIVSNGALTVRGDYFYPGSRGKTFTHITDGGAVTSGSCIASGTYTVGNVMRIDNGGEFIAGSVYCGWNVASEPINNGLRIEVGDRGRMTAHAFELGRAGSIGNTLVVSNGYFYTTGNCYSDSGTNATIILQGPRTTFLPYKGVASARFAASFCEFILDDYATYRPPVWLSYTSPNASNLTFRVKNGATLDCTDMNGNYGSISTTTGAVLFHNNKIIVEKGGNVIGSRCHCGGMNGLLRVDDSTIALASGSAVSDSMAIGFSGTWGGLGTNCTFVIAGSHPRVTMDRRFHVKNGSRLVFELPKDGYTEGTPIIETQDHMYVEYNAEVQTLGFTGAAEMWAAHLAANRRADYVLIANPAGKLTLDARTVAQAQATLPANMVLVQRTTATQNQLVLQVKVPTGTILNVQ